MSVISVPAVASAQNEGISLDWVKQSIEHQLARRGILKNDNLQVTITDGKITLTGHVDSKGEIGRAQMIAGRMMTGFVIENDLTVLNAPISDSTLSTNVQATINNSVFYSVFDWVRASAEDGVVTLSGFVLDPRRGSALVNTAAEVKGVKEVIDKTEILPQSSLDDDLRNAAVRAIYLDLYGGKLIRQPDAPIHVVAADGDLRLEGWVRSELDRTDVENYVAYYTSARKVYDELAIRP